VYQKINLDMGDCMSLYKYFAIPQCFLFVLCVSPLRYAVKNHHSPSLKTGIYTTAQKYKLFSSVAKSPIL
jgi:hypothetical protein